MFASIMICFWWARRLRWLTLLSWATIYVDESRSDEKVTEKTPYNDIINTLRTLFLYLKADAVMLLTNNLFYGSFQFKFATTLYGLCMKWLLLRELHCRYRNCQTAHYHKQLTHSARLLRCAKREAHASPCRWCACAEPSRTCKFDPTSSDNLSPYSALATLECMLRIFVLWIFGQGSCRLPGANFGLSGKAGNVILFDK